MKKVELSEATHAALQRLAAAKQVSPEALIATLLNPPERTLAGDSLLFYLAGDEFSRLTDATERYLDLLAWCATHYAADFGDFIAHQESGRRYLAWSRQEINEARSRNQARQIDGTQFWAVMTLDDVTRRRFVCRLLEFIGCHDETVALACRSLDLAIPTPSAFRLRGA